MQNISILPFQPKYQTKAKKLILAGLTEHWGTLDPSKNPDLDDIHSTYSNGMFFVALQENKIIGTGAIIPTSNETAEIVRMSVDSNLRRHGIGTMLLDKLCQYAKSNGYKQITLETTEAWHEVIKFYKSYGFQITHYLAGDVYFALDL